MADPRHIQSASTKPSSTLSKLLGRGQWRRKGGHKSTASHNYNQNLDNTLVTLPAELIALIASFLQPVSRLLLSLSSKTLRAVLTDQCDLSLDKVQTIDFLLLLERDLPEYLTCRSCAWMFKWRAQKHRHFQCPRRKQSASHIMAHGYPEPQCLTHRLVMGREMISLIFRAQSRGPNHGIPATYFNHECHSKGFSHPIWFRKRLEGRIVDGQFFLARSYSFVDNLPTFQDLTFRRLGLEICKHSTSKFTWEIFLSAKSWDRRQPFDLGTRKCNACATDFRPVLFPCDNDTQVRWEVKIWQNFGECRPEQRNSPPIFTVDNTVLDDELVARRDLERDFNASPKTISRERPMWVIAQPGSMIPLETLG